MKEITDTFLAYAGIAAIITGIGIAVIWGGGIIVLVLMSILGRLIA